MDIKAEELKKLEVFNNISLDTIKEILMNSDLKNYNSGQILFQDKESVTTVYFVIDGVVSLYKYNESGQKKVIFMLDKGKVINEVIIQDLPASINCEVFEDSVILGINRDKLLRIMKNDFELCRSIIVSLSSKTRRLYRQLKNTSSSIKMEKRLAAKLYKLGKDYGVKCSNGILIDIDMSITYLADLLGSQRETVSRALKSLEKQDLLIHKNKKIYLYDLCKLSEFFKTSWL